MAAEDKQGLWGKLTETRVIQTLAIYIPVAWVAVEIIDTLSERFALPGWLSAGAMILFIAGIPVTAFLAWAFQWSEHGPSAEMKGWRAGLVITIAIGILFGMTGFLMLNLDREALLEGGDALTDPVAVVGVLPFDQSDTDLEGLAEAMTLEISDRLARHPDLYVIGSGATFAPQLAAFVPQRKQQALQADRVVTGSVSRDREGYLLKLEFRDGEQQLWRDEFRFGANPGGRNGVLERAGKALAQQLGVRYQGAAHCTPSDNLEALEAYHSARLKLNQKGPENLAEAERLMKRAIELDPDYGQVYEGLAVTYLLQRLPEANSLAVELSRKALDRCPTLGAAYKIWVPAYEGVENHWIDQELQWRDALAMQPNQLWMLDNYASSLFELGRNEAALKITQRAYRNNPLDPRAITSAAWAHLELGNTDRALELAQLALDQGDNSCNAWMLRLRHAATSGTVEEATTAFRNLPDHCVNMFWSGNTISPERFFQARYDADARREVLDYLRERLDENPNFAMVHAIELGDLDLAFAAIERGMALQKFLFRISWWTNSEAFRNFRADPRFSEVVEEIGMVDYWREFGWPDGMCVPLGAGGFTCDV